MAIRTMETEGGAQLWLGEAVPMSPEERAALAERDYKDTYASVLKFLGSPQWLAWQERMSEMGAPQAPNPAPKGPVPPTPRGPLVPSEEKPH